MGYTPEQMAIIRQLKRSPLYGKSPKADKALMLAGYVESKFSSPNQANSDRDSEGPLQQRPSTGWGPTSEDATTDATQFLERALKLRGKYGSAGQLAQAVQRSAFPDRYDQAAGAVAGLLGKGGGSAGPVSSAGVPTSSSSAPETSRFEKLNSILSRLDQATPQITAFGRDDEDKQNLQGLARYGFTPYEGPTLSDTIAAIQRTLGTDSTNSSPSSPTGPMASMPTTGKGGKFKITGPNPGRIKPFVTNFMEQVAGVYGKPITASDGTGHSRLTVNGRVSEHTTGSAVDNPASGKELTRMGRAALIAAGMPRKQAMSEKGGLYNIELPGGGRAQIIFNTNEGGNHWDHLHVGIRPGRRK